MKKIKYGFGSGSNILIGYVSSSQGKKLLFQRFRFHNTVQWAQKLNDKTNWQEARNRPEMLVKADVVLDKRFKVLAVLLHVVDHILSVSQMVRHASFYANECVFGNNSM
jgi:hypothetical protein